MDDTNFAGVDHNERFHLIIINLFTVTLYDIDSFVSYIFSRLHSGVLTELLGDHFAHTQAHLFTSVSDQKVLGWTVAECATLGVVEA